MTFNRKTLRLVLLWISLFLMYRLADYSVSAAFLGAEPAQKLFNSFGMFLFWLALIGALVATVALLPYRGLGLLLMHLACTLVLVGGLLGSKAAHKLLYDDRLYKGYMQIGEGASSGEVFSAAGEPIGELDFEVALDDFRIDRYELTGEAAQWELWSGLRAADGEAERPTRRLQWEEGQPLSIPHADITVEVVDYRQREVPRPPGVVVIHSERAEDNGPTIVPAIVGRKVELSDTDTTIVVREVYRGLRIDPETKQPVDDPSRGYRPAAVLQVTREGEEPELAYAFTRELNARMRRPADEVFIPIDRPDMETLTVPTIKLRLWRDGNVQEKVFSPPEGLTEDVLPLAFMYQDSKAYVAAGEPILAFREPAPTIKTFESKVAVKKGGRTLERASIRVNHPLHYGGYHFYQTDYDHEGHAYTVLNVVSDRGWWLVYTGFALLFLGTIWHCWYAFFVRDRTGSKSGNEDRQLAAE